MLRETRYEGVLVENGRVLVLRTDIADQSIWLLPGGGREPGEIEAQCLARELREETGLEVEVGELLYEFDVPNDHLYRSKKAYRCRVLGGVLAAGIEPEEEFAARIVELRWLDPANESSWPEGARSDERTVQTLRAVRRALAGG